MIQRGVSIGTPPLALTRGPYEQERRALMFIRPARLRRYLLLGRSSFLDTADGEPDPDKDVEIACQGSMLLDHPIGEPVRRARAFIQVAVDRPSLVSDRVKQPAG